MDGNWLEKLFESEKPKDITTLQFEKYQETIQNISSAI